MTLDQRRWIGLGMVVTFFALLVAVLILTLSLYRANVELSVKDRELAKLEEQGTREKALCKESVARSAQLRADITQKNILLAQERAEAAFAASRARTLLLEAEKKDDTKAKRELALRASKRPLAMTPCEHADALIQGEIIHGPTH